MAFGRTTLPILWIGLVGSMLPVKAQSISKSAVVQQRITRDSFGVQQPARHPAAPTPAPPRAVRDPFVAAITVLNVKNFGAVCDGKTDDTTAIQNAYTTAAADMSKAGGAGIVYFPPSLGYCTVSTLHLPNMDYSQGWLTSLFDNGLFVTGTIYPGSNNAFIGRTSNFAALGNVFLWGPTAEWQKSKSGSTDGPLVDLDGVSDVYFEGMALANASPLTTEAIHVHDNEGIGSVTLNFERCSIIGDFDVDSSAPQQAAGFGLHIRDTTMGDIHVQNYGNITISDGYMRSMTMANDGIPSNGDLEISNMLVEGLSNQDFLTVDTTDGPITDISISRVALSDSIGSVYMLKHVNNTGINWNVNAKISMTPEGNMGTGLIDPASAPQSLSVICEGSGCDTVLDQAKNALYVFEGMPPKSPMLLYGSQYVPNPIVQVH